MHAPSQTRSSGPLLAPCSPSPLPPPPSLPDQIWLPCKIGPLSPLASPNQTFAQWCIILATIKRNILSIHALYYILATIKRNILSQLQLTSSSSCVSSHFIQYGSQAVQAGQPPESHVEAKSHINSYPKSSITRRYPINYQNGITCICMIPKHIFSQ